jgi:hypothetical protein
MCTADDFSTSRLWRHNCIILRIRLIRLLLSNHYMRLRCNPAKGRLTDIMFSFRKKIFCFGTNGIHFRMVVSCTCYLNNMYHYRYQERTPNTAAHALRVENNCGTPRFTEGRNLSMQCLRDYWHWLKIRGLKRNGLLV